VHDAVQRSGYSHRTLIDLFAGAVGLTPKRYARVRRFHVALRRASQHASWADIAAGLGYSDQAHFSREFREFAGVTPSGYRRAAPRFANHVPVEPGRR
jgi:AraC-like DNA-binding protein